MAKIRLNMASVKYRRLNIRLNIGDCWHFLELLLDGEKGFLTEMVVNETFDYGVVTLS